MRSNNTRKNLREASESIQRAVEVGDVPAEESRLTGIAEQLRYYIEGDTTDPEAMVSPRPDTLDTIQRNLSEIMEAEDDDVAEHLREARKHLVLTIVTLDDRRKKQHQFFAESTNKQ